MDVACDECRRKGSGSKDDLLLDGWVQKSPGRWLCPACVVTIQSGIRSPTVPPGSGREPNRS